MSIKYFHLLFMTVCILFSLMVAAWCLFLYQGPQTQLFTIVGGFFALMGACLLFYTFRFLKKIRKGGAFS